MLLCHSHETLRMLFTFAPLGTTLAYRRNSRLFLFDMQVRRISCQKHGLPNLALFTYGTIVSRKRNLPRSMLDHCWYCQRRLCPLKPVLERVKRPQSDCHEPVFAAADGFVDLRS